MELTGTAWERQAQLQAAAQHGDCRAKHVQDLRDPSRAEIPSSLHAQHIVWRLNSLLAPCRTHQRKMRPGKEGQSQQRAPR